MVENFERNKKLTAKIYGMVQGVGFRPFVKQTADKYGLCGRVLNDNGSVYIEAIGEMEILEKFLNEIIKNKPNASEIITINKSIDDIDNYYESFFIDKSISGDSEALFPPPDLSICDHCVSELFDDDDKRFRHPFISCTVCGPRYTIITDLPYDRARTTMKDFDMCEFCGGQYSKDNDHREHAQTMACNECGPKLLFEDGSSIKEENDALKTAISKLNDGEIVAIKGIGGYHLACNPFNIDSVNRLRELKGREQKPFAVMFFSYSEVLKHCNVSPLEQTLLVSREKPIVLLKLKEKNKFEAVFGVNGSLGVFLPYTPLHHLILKETGPLVMTSGNYSDAPIEIRDDRIFVFKDKIGGILYNDREILRRVDDSVVQANEDRVQIIRRARGFVPLPIFCGTDGEQILACGGQLKNTFCLSKGSLLYQSTHMGDLDFEENFDNYKIEVSNLKHLLKINPQVVCCDLHPGYRSSEYAKSLGIKVLEFQHHYAHVASVMAEHQLNEPVIGIAFDGTGYGDDNTVWGGEFFVATTKEYKRVAHLKPFVIQGGDKSVYDAKKIATCLLGTLGLENKIKDDRWEVIKKATKNNLNVFKTSSMGRLFDAVSSILDICHEATYEGECAIRLEACAESYEGSCEPYKYNINNDQPFIMDIKEIILGIYEDIENNIDKNFIANRFHVTISEMSVDICKRIREMYNVKKVAISGGVFQNRILLNLMLKKLNSEDFDVYINEKTPTNDGGISLGQAYLARFN